MDKVRNFEQLIAWQKARILAKEIYLITSREPFKKDFALCKQIQRSAVSAMSNIAEGFERGGRGEFHQFLVQAKASCAEVRSHLYVAYDIGYLDSTEFQRLFLIAEEVGRIIGALRVAVYHQRSRSKE